MSTIDWNVPIADYHASSHVSSSKLKTFASGGPRHYYMRHIQGTASDQRTDAKVFGQAFEDLLLEPELWPSKYITRPEGVNMQTKVGKAWASLVDGDFDERFVVCPENIVLTRKEGKAWKAANADGRAVLTGDELREAKELLPDVRGPVTVLDAGDVLDMQAMVTSIRENERAMALIRGARPQPTIRWRNARLLDVQARPDWLALDGCAATEFHPYSLDLKTTKHLSCIASGVDVRKFGYHSQAALVDEGVFAATGREIRTFLLAVEKCSPFRCQVVEITPEWLNVGSAWCAHYMDKLAEHCRTGEWPRVANEAVQLPPPSPWTARDIEDESEAA